MRLDPIRGRSPSEDDFGDLTFNGNRTKLGEAPGWWLWEHSGTWIFFFLFLCPLGPMSLHILLTFAHFPGCSVVKILSAKAVYQAGDTSSILGS